LTRSKVQVFVKHARAAVATQFGNQKYLSADIWIATRSHRIRWERNTTSMSRWPRKSALRLLHYALGSARSKMDVSSLSGSAGQCAESRYVRDYPADWPALPESELTSIFERAEPRA